ncbi:MAG: putative RNA binding protein YcfA (HicA-like mRNA interferase family) [Sulfurimonas sp.]|jgi:predicted RNA binding protein YcfA (HicA-like mRNA interferase family)
MPNITGRELIKFVKSIGYKLNRQKGSHGIFVHDYNKHLTIPVYKKKMVKNTPLRMNLHFLKPRVKSNVTYSDLRKQSL